MKRLILAFAALAAVSACSDSRERNIPVANQPDRPLRVAQPDTSDRVLPDLASRGDQPVSPVEQQAPRAEPAPKAPPVPRPQKRAAVRPKPPVDTATARGYVPPTKPDTVSAPPLDTARAAAPDTTTTAPAPDTVATAHADTLPADTTRSSSDSAVASSATVTAPAANASRLDDAARTLPIGTEIHAALDDSISSRRDSAGRTITAQISQSVTGAGGRVLIPAGSTVRLTVTRLASAKSKGSQGTLALKVDGIEVGGQLQNVQADVRAVPRELRSRGVTSGDAAKVGVGAVGGAVLGRVLGGNSKGAVIGGVVGAAGGAVVASQTATRDVVVKAKTPVTIVLTAPLVTP
jgi:glycine zipper 2TM protein